MAKTWISDANGNRCSVEYFGSVEAAQKALDSLVGCSDCSDCSRCSRCSDCSDCSGCSDCSDCSDCSGCSDCSRCSDCSGCSDCSRCSGCSDCSRCSDLEGLAPGERIGKIIVPVIANIHQKVYEAASIPPEALRMETWHTCGTTHCRGGWVVTLAGEPGQDLESRFNTELAAMMIYDASDPGYKINPCRFYDSNEAALADMKQLAEKEKLGVVTNEGK